MVGGMPYGPLLFLLATLFGVLGGSLWADGHHWGAIFWYPAASYALVAAGYLGLGGAWMLGKRRDGTRHWWGYVLAGPFLLFMFAGRKVLNLVAHREAAFDEVAPGVYVGRRLPVVDLPPGVDVVVDLTSEFAAPACVRTREGRYVCLPTLDGSAPSARDLRAVLDQLADAEGPLYVHCAAGHGRSAMLAATLLVRRGHAEDVDAAVALMQRARPGVRLMPAQRRRARQALGL